MREIYVAGCPSYVGGADTELYHQVLLWRSEGIPVVIVPNSANTINSQIKHEMELIGCEIKEYYHGIFNKKTVVNYCNGPALILLNNELPENYIFFNCMTWVFDEEIKHIRTGKITHLGFVSNYQKELLIKEYAKVLEIKEIIPGTNFPRLLDYYPFFDISKFNVINKTNEYFGIGRISRDDPAKFSTDCWNIFDRVLSPIPKKIFVLGYNNKIEEKIGKPPPSLDYIWWNPGMISSVDFYSRIDCLIHKTGGSRESYCRVLIEAMAYGIVPLVERDYAFPEILANNSELDWCMCRSSDEMSYKASELAFNVDKLQHYKSVVRAYAENHIVNRTKSIQGWLKLLV